MTDLPKECQDWIDAKFDDVLKPVTAYFDSHEWQDTIQADRYNPDSAGWYSRFSAPGYLDCTDWIGPFKSENEALIELWEMYGD